MSRRPRSLLLALVLACASCSVIRLGSDEPGADISVVARGAQRTQVEGALGVPVREWRNANGVDFRTYEYDAGREGSIGDASAAAFLDVATVFLWELFFVLDPEPFLRGRRSTGRVVVSYDADGVALGAFDEFAVLPADGRAPPGTATWTPAPRR